MSAFGIFGTSSDSILQVLNDLNVNQKSPALKFYESI